MADEKMDELQGYSKPAKLGFFGRIISKVWTIRSGDSESEDVMMKRIFQELAIYSGFLAVICVIAFGQINHTHHMFTQSLRNLFLDTPDAQGVTFRDIESLDQLWTYMKGPLMNGLYWERWYNGKQLPGEIAGYLYYHTKLLGVPRLRQVRVRSDSCQVNDEFKHFITDCYAEYLPKHEDKERLKREVNGTAHKKAWIWQNEEELGRGVHFGLFNTYQGSGYAQDLFLLRNKSLSTINYLQENNWIKSGVRAVFITFSVYNANIRLCCVVSLVVEFPSTGGILTSWDFSTIKLVRYGDQMGYVTWAMELLFCVYVAYYVVEEIIEIIGLGTHYFFDLSNLLDLSLIIIGSVCIGFNFQVGKLVKTALKEVKESPNKHANFEFLAFIESIFKDIEAVMVFFAWVKVFKYISFNKTMTQLATTLRRCAKDLLGFFIMFFVVFLAFTQLGYLIFGTKVKEFNTFMKSFFTLFCIVLGDFDFHQLEQANRILGPIFFLLFVFFVFCVLVNMFLAIINDTYSEVKSDMNKQADGFIMTDYLKQSYNRFWEIINKPKKGEQEGKYGEIDAMANVTFDDWEADLLTLGFDEAHLKLIRAQYDIDGDRFVETNERKKVLADLEKGRVTGIDEHKDALDEHEEEEAETFVAAEMLKTLTKRIDRLEDVLIGVSENMTKVLESTKAEGF